MLREQYLPTFITMCLAFAMAGCGTSRPTAYFVLESNSSLRTVETQPSSDKARVVGVVPVRMPEYLDRNELVTRSTNSTLNVSDFEAWAEPLESSITRAIAIAIDQEPGVKGSIVLPTIAEVDLDRVLLVELVRFDGMLGGSVRLTARILILDKNRKPVGDPVWFDHQEASSDGTYVQLVATMGRLLDQLGSEIAATLGAH